MPPPGPPARLELVAGDRPTLTAGGQPSDTLVVRVADAAGRGVPGVSVDWSTSGQGDAVSPDPSVTGADGIARARWTVGPAAGEHTATATVGTLSATVSAFRPFGAPAAVQIVAGNGQAPTSVGATDSLVVRVVDAGGNPLAGVPIAWSSSVAGDAVSPNPSLTNAAGEASVAWTPARIRGAHVVTAAAPNGPQAIFALTLDVDDTEPAAALVEISGDEQQGVRGRPLPQQLVVRAFDRFGNPTPGATVSWTSRPDWVGAVFSPAVSTTDAQGFARTTWTPSTSYTQAIHTAQATLVGPGSTASFTASVQRPAVASLAIAPDPLRVGCCFESTGIRALVRDDLGNPIPDAALSWEVGVDSIAVVFPSFRDTLANVRPTFPGTTTITVRAEGLSGSATVEVAPAAAGPHLQVFNPFHSLQGGGFFSRDQNGVVHPGSYDLRVRNSGGSGTVEGITVSVEYLSGQPGWLTTSLSSTTAPALLRVSVDTSVPVTTASAARVTVSSSTPGTTPVSLNFNYSP